MRAAIALFTLVFLTTTIQAQLEWKIYGSLKNNIVYPVVVRIGTDRALIMGGYKQVLWGQASSNVELLELVGGAPVHRQLSPMPSSRVEFPAINFGDTLIVALGGFNGSGVSDIVDGYDVRTGTWRTLGKLRYGRRQHVAYQLSDSEIVVVGGRHADLSTMAYAEVFNIKTGISSIVADYPNPINGGVSGLTSQGIGVVCAGRDGGPDGRREPEIYTYDQLSNQWVVVGALSSGREAPTGYRMEDGSYTIVGGSIGETTPTFIGDVVVESNGVFRNVADVGYGLTYSGVTEYRTGELLIVGGWYSDLSSIKQTTFVDPRTRSVTPGPDLNIERRYTRAVTLADKTSGRRYSFAIGGTSNSGTTFTIEVLGETCENEVRDGITDMKPRLYGTAAVIDQKIRLTDTMTFSAGAAWIPEKMSVASSFTTTFTFRLSDGSDRALIDGGAPGADGVALVIQNEAPGGVGEAGRGIGYDGLPHGLAIEFDSYLNAAFGDVSGSHVAVQVGDGYKLTGNHYPPYVKGMTYERVPDFKADGTTYHAKIEYDGSVLKVWCDLTGAFAEPVLEVPINISTELGLGQEGRAWMGITSATGFATERHEILSWMIGSCDPILVGVNDDRSDAPTNTSNDRMRIVPHPSRDVAQLEFADLQEVATVVISDLRGSELLRFAVDAGAHSVTLPVDRLDTGTYVVRVITQHDVMSLLWSVLH